MEYIAANLLDLYQSFVLPPKGRKVNFSDENGFSKNFFADTKSLKKTVPVRGTKLGETRKTCNP